MKHKAGMLEVITGAMFCGKTEELIRRLRRALIARQQVQVFKPAVDRRFSAKKVVAHTGTKHAAQTVRRASEILKLVEAKTTVVGIDEAQFLEAEIVSAVEQLVGRGVRVIVAGLDTDFRGEPFGPMPVLMAIADRVDKLQAICMVCGEPACRTQRLVNGRPARYEDPVVIIGAAELYEARCREHHECKITGAGRT